ncbi:hypothetical protein RchiOBHm_Chr3g0468401 [Rosa chinensis]|uniref:Transmembrane protein n=1 Tax=Rosa chinensis TaxID=74649 RepID=A0A2P6RAG8_ROSCH|nr:hypothetical protein RchiOBHm_Chr3g0468401 [Rosa chinensis]
MLFKSQILPFFLSDSQPSHIPPIFFLFSCFSNPKFFTFQVHMFHTHQFFKRMFADLNLQFRRRIECLTLARGRFRCCLSRFLFFFLFLLVTLVPSNLLTGYVDVLYGFWYVHCGILLLGSGLLFMRKKDFADLSVLVCSSFDIYVSRGGSIVGSDSTIDLLFY